MQLPPGFNFDADGRRAAQLAQEISALCFEHHVNAPLDLPPEPFQRAMTMQAEIDALRQLQRMKLLPRLERAHAKAREARALNLAARFERFREAVMARGGPRAINKIGLARDLGIARTTVHKYLRILEAQMRAGGHRCLACGSPIRPEAPSTVHDEQQPTTPPSAAGEHSA